MHKLGGKVMSDYDGFFPYVDAEEYNKDPFSCQAFGKRITANQSMYEYLLEFLLIFCSVKKCDYGDNGNKIYYDNTKLKFHSYDDYDHLKQIKYYANPRMGLKRFIFFNNSKREGRFSIDEQLYDEIKQIIQNDIVSDEPEIISENLQDLLYGFSAVLKNRSWFAQSLLPLCPEIIFNESLANRKMREFRADEDDYTEVEKKFNFTQHDFMARGGEVYYLHVLQSLNDFPNYKNNIENGLRRLLGKLPELSLIANFIQMQWEKEKKITPFLQEYKCAYIPNEYRVRSEYTCIELENFLKTSINTLKKIEILSQGIILQMIRMIHIQACARAMVIHKPLWIVDMRTGNINIKTFAESSYRKMNEDITAALLKGEKNIDKISTRQDKLKSLSKDAKLKKLLRDGQKESSNVIKKLGKELKLIIPARGAGERFYISEGILNFLVLSIIEPGQKMTLNKFMEKLYQHYGIVISSKQIHEYCLENNIDTSTAAYFKDNEKKFKEFVKNCGYLKELSDATSIVFNPYEREETNS